MFLLRTFESKAASLARTIFLLITVSFCQLATALDENSAQHAVHTSLGLLDQSELQIVKKRFGQVDVRRRCDPADSMAQTIPRPSSEIADIQICLNHITAASEAATAALFFYQIQDPNERSSQSGNRLRSIFAIGAVLASGLDLKNLAGGRQVGSCRPVFRTYIAIKGLDEYQCETLSINSVARDRMWARLNLTEGSGSISSVAPLDAQRLSRHETSVLDLLAPFVLKLAVLHELAHIIEGDHLSATQNLASEIRADKFARDMLHKSQSIDDRILVSLASFASIYHAAAVLTTVRKSVENTTARTDAAFESLQSLLIHRRGRN